jgi:RND family efflux transporter MFP subunit
MRQWLRYLVLVIAAAAAVGAMSVMGGWLRNRDPAGGQGAGETSPPQPIAVRVEPVAFRSVQRSVDAVGTLCAFEVVSVAAKVDGQVKRILCDVGDRIKPGEPLLEIDPVDYDLALRRAEKALQADLSRIGLTAPDPQFDVENFPTVWQARARRENAAARLKRLESLAQERAASQEQVDNARTEDAVALAEYNNQLLLAASVLVTLQDRQLAIAMANQKLSDAVVRAPVPSKPLPGDEAAMTYAITARTVAEGTYVRVGTEVFRLLIDRPLKLLASVPERHAAEVRPGQQASIKTVAAVDCFVGTVARINPAIDPATRTFEVEILVPNPQGELKPGSFAKAAILTAENPRVATVPLEALVSFAGTSRIFVVENDRAKEVRVTVGFQAADWAEIVSPALPEGALVVMSGHSAISDGSPLALRAVPSAVAARKEAMR